MFLNLEVSVVRFISFIIFSFQVLDGELSVQISFNNRPVAQSRFSQLLEKPLCALDLHQNQTTTNLLTLFFRQQFEGTYVGKLSCAYSEYFYNL